MDLTAKNSISSKPRRFGALSIFFLSLFLTVSLSSLQAQVVAPSELGIAQGTQEDRISLELKGVDILDVLKVLAKKSGLNIVVGKNVRGQVTLFLQNVVVRDALDIILETAELAYEEKEGILKVVTAKDYEAVYGKPYQDRRELRTFTLRYAKAADVLPALEEIKSALGKVVVEERTNKLFVIDLPEILDRIGEALSNLDMRFESRVLQLRYAVAEDLQPKVAELLTPGLGKVNVDARSNRLLVQDRANKMPLVERVVKEFDVPPRQVEIDTKVIQVELSDRFRFGIDWNYVALEVQDLDTVNLDSPLTVSAPSAGGTLTTLTFGAGSDDFIFAVQLLERMGKTNTLSSPRLTVLNNQEARIAVATREPFVSQTVVQGDNTSTTADNVQFVDVGVTMSVTPTITDDHYVLMKLKPQVSTQGTAFTISDSAGVVTTRVPVVTAQEIETTVLARSGDTVVLGGIIQDSDAAISVKLPILGDIPFIGGFFRSKSNDFTKSELVFFLTPTVLSQGAAGRAAAQEHDLYFDREFPTQTKEFDETGGFSYEKGQHHSQGIMRSDDRPFWKLQGDEVPQWRQGQGLFGRENMLYNLPRKISAAEAAQRAVVLDHALAKSSYAEALRSRLLGALAARPELNAVGPVDLELVVSRGGDLEELSFRNDRVQANQALADTLISAVRGTGPFPQFPSALSSPRERFRMTLSGV